MWTNVGRRLVFFTSALFYKSACKFSDIPWKVIANISAWLVPFCSLSKARTGSYTVEKADRVHLVSSVCWHSSESNCSRLMALPGSLKIHWHLHWLGNKCPLIVSPVLNLPPSLGYAEQEEEVATALRTHYSHFSVSSLSLSKFALRKIH